MPKYDEKFKRKAVKYFAKHTEKTGKECAAKFGISYATLAKWYKEATECDEVDRTDYDAEERAIFSDSKREANLLREFSAIFEDMCKKQKN